MNECDLFRNEAWCSVWCLWNNCPGFKVVNQACHLLMENQTLPIATKSNGTSLYIRSELIQQGTMDKKY